MIIYDTQLEAKVAAENAVNQAAMDIWPDIRAALLPWLGQKVQNQGGEMAAKVVKTLPVLPSGPGQPYHGWYESRTFGIWAHVRVCVSVKGRDPSYQTACYAERTIYAAEVTGGHIKEVAEVRTLRTDYAVEPILQAREELKQAKAAVSAIESRLFPFGEHDN